MGAGNLISANGISGVLIDAGATAIVVQGNLIGTSGSGNAALGNANDGVEITTAGNTIGGTTTGAGNLVSGNGYNGIEITGTGASGDLVQGNLVGVTAGGGGNWAMSSRAW